MNAAQLSKFHVNKAKWLRSRAARGLPADEAALDALKLRKIGRVCSSKDFSQHDLDEMLGAFFAETKADDFDAQMEQQEQPERRRDELIEGCRRACWDMYQLGDNGLAKVESQDRYLAGTARAVVKKEPDDCSEAELAVVRGCLLRRVGVLRKTNPAAAASLDKERARKAGDEPY